MWCFWKQFLSFTKHNGYQSMIINRFRLVLPLRWSRHWYCPFQALMVLNKVFCDNNLVIKEKQFVRMLHVINEVTIDTCDIHQIKENAVVKSNTWLLIQTICGRTLVHKINSTYAAIVKLDNLGQGTKDLVFEPFFLLWTDNMSFIPSKADDKSSTDRFSIHLQAIVLPEKRNSQSPLFICLSSIIFGIYFLLARAVPIP